MILEYDRLRSITKRLSHAYITDDDTADSLAIAVVCGIRDGERPCLNCIDCDKAQRKIHPDITTVRRIDDKRNIVVDQIRELKQDVFILPNDSISKVYVIKDAETMNINAQNAFLQILEEPPTHVVFILCTPNASALLPTVRSRCVELSQNDSRAQITDVSPEKDQEHDLLIAELTDAFIDALGDNLKLAEVMFRIDKLERLSFERFLVCTRTQIASTLRTGKGSLRKKHIRSDEMLIKAEEMLNFNVSIGHIAGMLCADLMQN